MVSLLSCLLLCLLHVMNEVAVGSSIAFVY